MICSGLVSEPSSSAEFLADDNLWLFIKASVQGPSLAQWFQLVGLQARRDLGPAEAARRDEEESADWDVLGAVSTLLRTAPEGESLECSCAVLQGCLPAGRIQSAESASGALILYKVGSATTECCRSVDGVIWLMKSHTQFARRYSLGAGTRDRPKALLV